MNHENSPTPIENLNLAEAELLDRIGVDSVSGIDEGAKRIGHQLMIICGFKHPFNPDYSGYFGQRDSFQPLSDLVSLNINPDEIIDPTFHVLTAPRTSLFNIKDLSADRDTPNFFHYVTCRFAVTVGIKSDNSQPLTHGRIFRLLGYNDAVKMEKTPTPIIAKNEEELTLRLSRALSQKKKLHSSRENIRPNRVVSELIEKLR